MHAALRVTLAASVAVAAPALADFVSPDAYGWSREQSRSTYFEWDFFQSAGGGNQPDVGLFPDPLPAEWTEPDAIETTGNGFVTGSGNFYSPFGPINVAVTVPNYDNGTGRTTLLLQVRTVGNELDYAGVALDGELPAETVELFREGSDMGLVVDTLFRFEVDGNAPEYVFDIPTPEAHVSIDRISIDTLNSAGCTADFNGDGEVDTRDFIEYLNAWSSGDLSADLNDDGRVNTLDFIAFLDLWSSGC